MDAQAMKKATRRAVAVALAIVVDEIPELTPYPMLVQLRPARAAARGAVP